MSALLKTAPPSVDVLIASGNLSEAEVLCQQALQADAKDAQMLLAMGKIKVKQGGVAQGQEYFAKARAVDPSLFAAWYNAGLMYFKAGQHAEAMPLLAQAAALNPQMAEAIGMTGICLHAAGHCQEAKEYFLRALKIKPDWLELTYFLGSAAVRMGQFVEAKTYLEQAVAHKPDWAEALAELGGVMMNQRLFAEAEPYLKKALAAKPEWTELYLTYAGALAGQGKHQEAVTTFAKILAAKADWAEALQAMANSQLALGQNKEAEETLKRAVALKPDSIDMLALLAKLYLEQERYAEALPVLETIVWHRPEWSKMKADLSAVKGHLAAKKPKMKAAPWPKATRALEDFDALCRQYVLEGLASPGQVLKKGDTVFAFGSCFAQNMAVALKRYPLTVDFSSFNEEANSTYANKFLFEWITHGARCDVTRAMEELFTPARREEFIKCLTRANLIIMTIGVAPCFFTRDKGEFVFLTGGTEVNFEHFGNQYEFRTTTVDENTKNLKDVMTMLRAINPKATVVLSLSPVPLRGTYEMPSAVMADCLSKSTLRLAIEALLKSKPQGVYYWPAFEMIKWLGAHLPYALYGTEDNNSRHVSSGVVDKVIAAFLKMVGDKGLGVETGH